MGAFRSAENFLTLFPLTGKWFSSALTSRSKSGQKKHSRAAVFPMKITSPLQEASPESKGVCSDESIPQSSIIKGKR